MPQFFAGGYWLIGVDLVLIVLYFGLTFEAGRDFEAQKLMEQFRRRKSAPRSASGEKPSALGRLGRRFVGKKDDKAPAKRDARAESSGLGSASDGDPARKPSGKTRETPVGASKKAQGAEPKG